MKNPFYLLLCLCFSISSFAQYTLDAKIVPNAADRAAGDHFTHHGGLSIDGDYAVGGSHFRTNRGLIEGGIAFLFWYDEENCVWVQVDVIEPETAPGVFDTGATGGDQFGMAVSIKGNRIAIGAPRFDTDFARSGKVYIYEIIANEAIFIEALFPWLDGGVDPDFEANANFGGALDMDENQLIIGSSWKDDDGANSGCAYLYTWDGAEFDFENKLNAPDGATSDKFGYSVAIHGAYAAVGSPFDNSGRGAVYIFDNYGGPWTFNDKLIAPDAETDDNYGISVDITQNYIAVGAPNEDDININNLDGEIEVNGAGSTYMYELFTTGFTFVKKLVHSDRTMGDNFGWFVQMYNNTVVVGAPFKNDVIESLTDAGYAYIFKRELGVWTEDQILSPDFPQAGAIFGDIVAISEYHVAVGAFGNETNATELLPLGDAGAAYIFSLPITDPIINEVSSNQEGVCDGDPITLSVDGILNSAFDWEWHIGTCTGPIVGTGEETIIEPSETTTYCVRPIGCFDYDVSEDCECIEIEVNDGNWHQTTNIGYEEDGNDIITDADGSVYVTGFFLDKVTFDGGDLSDVVIPTAYGYDKQTFVIKYDECGNLLWAVVADGNTANMGNSITLREEEDYLYITGEFNNQLILHDGVGAFGIGGVGTKSVSRSGLNGYIARINRDDGEVDLVESIIIDGFTSGPNLRGTAITINENNGEIFVAGDFYETLSQTKIFIQRYDPTAVAMGPREWEITSDSYNSEARIKALDFDEDSPEATTSGALWAIGDFRNELSFDITGVDPTIGTVGPNRDAFVAKFFDNGTSPTFHPDIAILREGNISPRANDYMEGNDIAVDPETGTAFLTGTKIGQSNATYAFYIPNSELLYADGNKTGYFVAMAADGGEWWDHAEITNTIFDIRATGEGVAVQSGNVYFIGDRNYNTYFIADDYGGSLLPYMGLAEEDLLYIVAYKANISGTYLWSNGTTNPTLEMGTNHFSSKIATTNTGHAFITGKFRYSMGFMYGMPESGDLFFSSNGGSLFTLRVDLDGVDESALESPPLTDNVNKFENNGQEAAKSLDLEKVDSNFDNQYLLVPNPANSTFKIWLSTSGKDYNQIFSVKLFSTDGKLVYSESNYINQQEIPIDFLESGIYLVHIDGKEFKKIKKLIIQ